MKYADGGGARPVIAEKIMKLKMMFLVLMMASVFPSLARAQSKAGRICVWADSEDPAFLCQHNLVVRSIPYLGPR